MLKEGRKRDAAANAILALSFAANAAQSPEGLIKSGKVEAPGTQLMANMMRKRKEANRNLDSGRVSHPARNRKKSTVGESQEHSMKEVESKLPKGHKLKNERKGKGDHVFFDVVDDKGNAIQTPVPVGGAKKGKNKYSSSLKGTATNAGNFIKKVHQEIDDVQASKPKAPTTADRMSAAYKKRMSEIPAKEKYKKASSIMRKMKRKPIGEFVERNEKEKIINEINNSKSYSKMKTFKEFLEEAYLYEMRKEDKVKGKQKTPLNITQKSARVVKAPEGSDKKWEVKKSSRTTMHPDAEIGRYLQGMRRDPHIRVGGEMGGASGTYNRHAHGGGGYGAKAPGRKRGVGKIEQQKIDKEKRDRGERPIGTGISPVEKIRRKKLLRNRNQSTGRRI